MNQDFFASGEINSVQIEALYVRSCSGNEAVQETEGCGTVKDK